MLLIWDLLVTAGVLAVWVLVLAGLVALANWLLSLVFVGVPLLGFWQCVVIGVVLAIVVRIFRGASR